MRAKKTTASPTRDTEIDSLVAANKALAAENEKLRKQMEAVKDNTVHEVEFERRKSKEFAQKNSALKEQVALLERIITNAMRPAKPSAMRFEDLL